MLNRRSRVAGMTLIELMIGMAIIGFVLVLGVPSFSTAIKNSRVRSMAQSIHSGLATARAEALSRNTLVDLVVAADFSWDVCLDSDAACTSIQHQAAASATGTSVTVAVANAATKAVVTTATTWPQKFTFDGLGRVTSLAAGTVNTIDVTYPTGGTCATSSGGGQVRCMRVELKPAGQVRLCDPARSATSTPPDPQACQT